MSYRIKLLAFLILGLTALFVFNVGYSALNTLLQLDAVEAQRDTWQRPQDVLSVLNPKPGDTVADIGCGSGYFALKLSSAVGTRGRVVAEDIRMLPLTFLWIRSLLKGNYNISVVRGEPSDPRLPAEQIDEVLIANTYHEFSDSQAMREHIWRSLALGGRLVVVDRAPNAADAGVSQLAEHEISADRVQAELVQTGFEIVGREGDFIEKDPQNETWWLISARKP